MKSLINSLFVGACLISTGGCSSSSSASPVRDLASALDTQIRGASVCVFELNIQPAQPAAACSASPDGTTSCPAAPAPGPYYVPRYSCDGSSWQNLNTIAASATSDNMGVEFAGQLKTFTSNGMKIVSCTVYAACILSK